MLLMLVLLLLKILIILQLSFRIPTIILLSDGEDYITIVDKFK